MTQLEKLYNLFLQSTGVTTYTRKIRNGVIFFALKGANFNGNQFAEKALESGANYAVIDEKQYAISDKYLLVENVLSTLQQLANYHRKQFNIPFIGITGSNGKTTTTNLTAHVLRKGGLDVGVAGNIGKSLAAQLLDGDHDYWVLEVSSC